MLLEEDHTLGNALRYMIMKESVWLRRLYLMYADMFFCSPRVEFCGYSAPHPSEDKIHLRIQMYDRASAVEALIDACSNLEAMTEVIEQRYQESLDKKEYEVVENDDPVVDWDAVKAKASANREAKAKAERAKEQAAARR